jgi:putative DNA primase/helicase
MKDLIMNFQIPSSISYTTSSFQPPRVASKPASSATAGISFPVTRAHHERTPSHNHAQPSGSSASVSPSGTLVSDNRTIEKKYFDHLIKGRKYAKRDGLLHVWNGCHWEALDGEAGIGEAMEWLDSFHPGRVTKATAKSCYETATLLAKPVPTPSSKRCIIPLRNVYLEVCSNGTVTMLKPDPSFGITYALNAGVPFSGSTYSPAAVPATSMFGKFLQSSVPDVEVQEYLQEFMGYTLTPFSIYQIALLLKGSGNNGKSVMVRILSALHGRIAPMDLEKLRGFALTPLVGASLAVCDEVPKSGLDTNTLKALITGDPVQIDRKYLTPIAYRSTAKWVICTNHDQRTNDNSNGFWRRMIVIPFTHQIAAKDVVPGLDAMIIDTELRIVLDWCLAGLQRLMKRGKLLPVPQAVAAAKELAIIASDPVAAWVQECGVQTGIESADLVAKDDVFKRYCNWCSTNKAGTMISAAFWTRLRDLVKFEPDVQLRIDGPRRRYVQIRFECDVPPEPVIAGTTPFDDA